MPASPEHTLLHIVLSIYISCLSALLADLGWSWGPCPCKSEHRVPPVLNHEAIDCVQRAQSEWGSCPVAARAAAGVWMDHCVLSLAQAWSRLRGA